MRRLFVRVGKLDQVAVVVWSADETNARRQIVARKARGDDDGRNVNQKGIQMRRAFLVDEGWVDAVFDQRRLVLDGFVHDRVQLVVGHDFEKMRH